MKHQEIHFLLSSYVDEELTDAERSVVIEHLKGCAECRRRVNELTTIKRNVHATGDIDLPFAFAGAVARSIHHDEEVTTSWLGIEHYALRLVFGLALLVMILLGVTSYKQSRDLLPMERYVSGVSSDSAVSLILTKQGAITRDDVMFAVLTK